MAGLCKLRSLSANFFVFSKNIYPQRLNRTGSKVVSGGFGFCETQKPAAFSTRAVTQRLPAGF